MRRARRIFFRLATILSLVLLILSVGMWVRSNYRNDELERLARSLAGGSSTRDYLELGYVKGSIYIESSHEDIVFEEMRPVPSATWNINEGPGPSWNDSEVKLSQIGFQIGWAQQQKMTAFDTRDESILSDFFVLVPLWFLCAAFTVLPAWWLGKRLATRRARITSLTGVIPCPTCGYDLRETPTRCPECGSILGPAEPIP